MAKPAAYPGGMKLSELASALGCEIRGGSESLEITGVAGMEQATPSEVTFLANPKYAHKLKHTRAGAVLVAAPVEDLASVPVAQLISSNPYLDFARALALFYQPPRPKPGIHPLAWVATSASLGENASIGPFAVVGENVSIGHNAVLHSHVVIYEGAVIGDDFYAHAHAVVREHCRVGNRVILQNGVIVGGDGYGFAKRADGSHAKIVQSGVTVIEDDVEIQTLTSVDRASVGETRVKRGAKIDSLVQVGHGCVVGEDNIICSQTGSGGVDHSGQERSAGRPGGRLRTPDHSRRRGGVRAKRRRSRRRSGRGHQRFSRLRGAPMAARHHRLPEIAGDFEDNKTIGETPQSGGTIRETPPMNERPR